MAYGNRIAYQAAAAADVVVKAAPGRLYGVIIGADVASSVIEISDSATDGDGNIKIKLAGSALMTANNGGLYFGPEGIAFDNGIAADITLQSDVTFIYS